MYTNLKDFFQDWENESKETLRLLNSLTDSTLNQKSSPSDRSIGSIAWHICISIGEMFGKAGIKFDYPKEDSEPPSSVKEICETYENLSNFMIAGLKSTWNDESLNEEVEMYGEIWRKATVLDSSIKHQVHHRGQLTILMRLAGLKVHGIYGPSREEWEQMGIPPMK